MEYGSNNDGEAKANQMPYHPLTRPSDVRLETSPDAFPPIVAKP